VAGRGNGGGGAHLAGRRGLGLSPPPPLPPVRARALVRGGDSPETRGCAASASGAVVTAAEGEKKGSGAERSQRKVDREEAPKKAVCECEEMGSGNSGWDQ
jgi:hypothetical protein